MKKILSLILVCVMLVVTLASCSYSFANDSMSNYATFGDAEFKAFTYVTEHNGGVTGGLLLICTFRRKINAK